MPGEPEVNQAECRLAGEAAQVGAARRFVAEFLGGDWPALDAAVLLTSELAANAVVFFLLSSRVVISALSAVR